MRAATRGLLAAATLAAAAFGAAPAAADPTCFTTSAVKGGTIEVCGPGMTCGENPCHWRNHEVNCTHTGPIGQVCDLV